MDSKNEGSYPHWFATGQIGIKVMEVAQNKQTGETTNQKANQINKKYICILKNKTKTLRWID